METLDHLIAATPKIATIPESVISVLLVLEDPTVGAHDLIPIVEKDPGLTANLLKLCNSSIYATWREIGTVKEALVRIGNRAFARLVFALGVEPVIHSSLPGYQMSLDQLWQHSLAVAYAAAHLVKSSPGDQLRDRAFTAGLLHDVGKVALDGLLVEGKGEDEGDLVAAGRLDREREITGFDHAKVGAGILDAWKLPPGIVEAVAFHHQPELDREGVEISRAVYSADYIHHLIEAGPVESGVDSDRADLQELVKLGVPEQSLDMLLMTLPRKTGDMLTVALGRA